MTTGLFKKKKKKPVTLYNVIKRVWLSHLDTQALYPDFNLGIHLLVQQSTEHLLRTKNKDE